MADFMRHMVLERQRNRSQYAAYAAALKVLSNSIYGSIGYKNSRMYTPLCAASVTAIGRHCIKLAKRHFEESGLSVIYGDTDSCMVTSMTQVDLKQAVDQALHSLHKDMANGPLSLMKMNVEETYKKSIMIDKKRYCMLRADDTLKYVGMRMSRKDVTGISKLTEEMVGYSVFWSSGKDLVSRICNYMNTVAQLSQRGQLRLGDVSRYVKKDGISCYCYTNKEGLLEYVPEECADLDSCVECDSDKIIASMKKQIEKITTVCMIGSVAQLVSEWDAGIF
ncbi:hypothetical protein K3495_g715 [Podosphaera aphanis]|nr:hypothetical protein K3495_g715 [Podosphaera aphanis]